MMAEDGEIFWFGYYGSRCRDGLLAGRWFVIGNGLDMGLIALPCGDCLQSRNALADYEGCDRGNCALEVGEIRPYFFTDEAVDTLVIGVEGVGAEFEIAEQENHEANG